jgi:hypothetical protein
MPPTSETARDRNNGQSWTWENVTIDFEHSFNGIGHSFAGPADPAAKFALGAPAAEAGYLFNILSQGF